jgi:hypothetical protein
MRPIVVCFVFLLAACGGSAPGPPSQAEVIATIGADLAPTGTSQSIAPPKPTQTPAPTNTPKPTSTPRPTATPSPVPSTPTPIPSVVIEGKGQTVTDPFTPPSSINRVTFTHKGSSNFIVHSFAANGDEGSLVNVIGNYQGIRPLLSENPPYYFEVKADGTWSIRVEPITDEPGAVSGISGKGDYVSGLFQPTSTGPKPYNLTHNGEGNFIVHLFCAGGQDSVENEIGAVNGSVVARFEKGPCFWEVRADGDWTIKPK